MARTEDPLDAADVSGMLTGEYLSGACTAFTVAVHRRTGWPLVALRQADGALVHSGVRAPDGGFADARGLLDEHGFRSRFEWARDIADADEATLLSEHPQGEWLIARAGLHAELILDLPGRSPHRDRFEGFAMALEALCREHGVWLRGPGPGTMEHLVAYEAYGEEGPFRVGLLPAGGAHLTRTLGPDRDAPLRAAAGRPIIQVQDGRHDDLQRG